jgi:hypothetical protein
VVDPVTMVSDVLSLGTKVALEQVTSHPLWPLSAEHWIFTFTHTLLPFLLI